MIVLDSSAVVASLAGEPGAAGLRHAIGRARACEMSAVNVLECRIVLGLRFGDAMLRELELLLAKVPVGIVAFDAEHASLAYRAYRRFGKGTGHPARLNFGDCAAYALARTRDLPLLFVGNDFSHTDIRVARTEDSG